MRKTLSTTLGVSEDFITEDKIAPGASGIFEIEIDPNAHAFDNDADIDCNNGCGFVRVSYGDSNGDGEINNKDIYLSTYLYDVINVMYNGNYKAYFDN